MAKRYLDLFVALIGLFLLSPFLFVVGALITIDSPGPVLYKGDRIGQSGIPFKMLKFRTMVVDADQMGSALTHAGDLRVTRVGRILRRWKIDEIPQLINVVRGEMSLVGPRPESPGYVRYYTPEQRRVLQVKPGITGITQIKFRHEETLLSQYVDREQAYITTIMPQKLALDLRYIETHDFLSDLALIVQTLQALFTTAQATEDAADVSETAAV